jgi:hypothetical protein
VPLLMVRISMFTVVILPFLCVKITRKSIEGLLAVFICTISSSLVLKSLVPFNQYK